MTKREGTDQEIIDWARENPGPQSEVAPAPKIKNNWVCGSNRAARLNREAKKKSTSDSDEKVRVRASDDELQAEISFKTDPGAEPGLEQALGNPKFQKALASGDIDLDDYEIASFESNSWDVTLKNDTGQPIKRTNHQFKIKWKLAQPEPLEIAVQNLCDSLPDRERPDVQADRQAGDLMAEVALYDVHFGLLAWAAETGEDYDVQVARRVFGDAIEQIAQRVSDKPIDHFLFPIGNDFFHVNNVIGKTPRNQNELDVDTRLGKIIEKAQLALIDAVDQLAEQAPVELVWVPGNHDPQTSYYLMRILDAWYRDDKRITVDTSPQPRKIRTFGRCMCGFMHGCDIAKSRKKALPGLLADEAGDEWGSGQYREIHHGHYHSKGELYFHGASEEGGVVVRTIPSLVGTDYWHYSKGFVGTSKTAQLFLWDRAYGLQSIHDIHVDKSLYSQEADRCKDTH